MLLLCQLNGRSWVMCPDVWRQDCSCDLKTLPELITKILPTDTILFLPINFGDEHNAKAQGPTLWTWHDSACLTYKYTAASINSDVIVTSLKRLPASSEQCLVYVKRMVFACSFVYVCRGILFGFLISLFVAFCNLSSACLSRTWLGCPVVNTASPWSLAPNSTWHPQHELPMSHFIFRCEVIMRNAVFLYVALCMPPPSSG
jgi:hypothetical protein